MSVGDAVADVPVPEPHRTIPVEVRASDTGSVHVETRSTDWIVPGLRPDRVAETLDHSVGE